MKLFNPFDKGQAKWRAKKLVADAKSCYDGMVYHCRKLSAYDNTYAFIIHRSDLGWPIIEQIVRPEEVRLSELKDDVVIKDGYIYSISKKDKTNKE